MQTLKTNQKTVSSNEDVIADLLDWDSKAGYIEFLLSMQQDFLRNNFKKDEEAYVDTYVEECLFKFKKLIEFIAKIEHPKIFTERIKVAA